jgi:hypothetical protein
MTLLYQKREAIMSQETELAKQKFGALFTAVSAVMFDVDPMRINCIDNTDEYDPEAASVLLRLHSAQSVLEARTIIHEEFVHWFDDMAGDEVEYTEVADRVWALWKQNLS